MAAFVIECRAGRPRVGRESTEEEEGAMGIMDSFNDQDGKANSGAGKYRVMQIVLREKFTGKGSKNFREIEDVCNEQYANGYRLHTFAQSTANSSGFGGGDRTVCNLVFERVRD